MFVRFGIVSSEKKRIAQIISFLLTTKELYKFLKTFCCPWELHGTVRNGWEHGLVGILLLDRTNLS